MKKLIHLVLLFFVMHNLYSQQLDIPCFYKKDNSCLILNKNTAEFKMHEIKYGIRYIKGKGAYCIEDSVIYIKTAHNEGDNLTRFEDVGQSELKDKLFVEVFDENNARVSRFTYEIINKNKRKQNNRYREISENGVGEIDLNRVRNLDCIWISAISNNYLANEMDCTGYSRNIKIHAGSIKTNKIKVYLTCDEFVYDKVVKFELGRDDQGIFVFGPKGIYRDEPVKTKFYFLTKRIVLPVTSNKKIKMYEVTDTLDHTHL